MRSTPPQPEQWSNRALARLLLPLIGEQILTLTMGIADTIMVSGVGEFAVSGVSLVDSINSLIIMAFAALAAGGTVVVSQYLGRGDMKNASLAARQLMYAATGISLLLMLPILFIRRPILSLVFGSLSGDVMEAAAIYFLFTALSFPFLAIYNSTSAIYRAMSNSRVPMLIALLVNVLKIGGNVLFIFGLHMGTAGAGLSTLILRVAAAVILTAMLMSGRQKIVSLEGLFRIKLEFSMIRSILSVGIPSALENSMFYLGRLLTTRFIAAFGTAAIAANAISTIVNSICFMPGQAFGLALLTIVGQCVGRRDYNAARYYTKKIIKICYITLITLSITNLVFLEPIVSLFKLSPEAHAMAKSFLMVHSVTLGLFWPLSFGIPSALRAAGDATYCMIVATLTMYFIRISGAYILVFPLGAGPLGVWFAMGADFIARSFFYTMRWRKGKWQQKKVID